MLRNKQSQGQGQLDGMRNGEFLLTVHHIHFICFYLILPVLSNASFHVGGRSMMLKVGQRKELINMAD